MNKFYLEKGKYFFGFAFFVLLFQAIDRALLDYSVVNNKLIFGYFGSNKIAVIISLFLLGAIYLLTSNRQKNLLFIVLAAGVISNIIDRILYGGVIDYINIWFVPTFNFADVAIIATLILLFWQEFRSDIKKSP